MDEDQVFICQVAEIVMHGLKYGQIAARKKLVEMQKEFDWNDNQMLYIAKHVAEISNNPVACQLITMLIEDQNFLRKIIEKRFDSIK